MKVKFLALALLAYAQVGLAQFSSQVRVGHLTQTHSTVGTSTAAAISAGSVLGNIVKFSICNDAVNTSTYLLVGQAVDAATDGVMLAPGACFECPYCTGAVLKAMKVKAQAASNGYSVIQYRQ